MSMGDPAALSLSPSAPDLDSPPLTDDKDDREGLVDRGGGAGIDFAST